MWAKSLRLWEHKRNSDPLFDAIRAAGGAEAFAKREKRKLEEVMYEVALWRYKHDSEAFCAERLKIVDKNANLIPLIFNNGQKKINSAIERQKIAGKPVRVALLKARQFGGSTEFEAEVFKESVLRPMRQSMIIAHDLDSARHLRDMSARYYENYDLPKPEMKKETDKWWKFRHVLNGKRADSHIRIDTAEELSTGHSLTLHTLHLSEIQNWRNAPVLVKGLFPTVPNHPDTMIFMEGTGSGVGDYWYDFCQMAKEDSVWEFVFVPWFEIEDYEVRFDSEEKRADFEVKLDSEERLLRKESISLEKLNWRRETIRSVYKGDDEAFRQQYPATSDEAFLTSGRPVFPAIRVREKISEALKPLKIGYLEGVKDVKFREDPKGYWEIWEQWPEKVENLYCLGADVAEGLAIVPELGNRGGDYSCAKILRRDYRQFVARLHARLDPDLFADELLKAWKYWGCGLLIESNPGGSGNVVIRALKSYPGINLLRARSLSKPHEDRKEEFGWKTMKDTKRLLIDELLENIREENFIEPSKNFWYECSTYVRDEKGATNAQSRKYDDEVIANAIAFQADKLMPLFFKPITGAEETPLSREYDVPRLHNLSQARVMEENYV